jgi:hypothetical protein
MTLPRKDSYLAPTELLLREPLQLKVLPGVGNVTPQVLMSTVAENYGICHENIVAQQELINWIKKQKDVSLK